MQGQMLPFVQSFLSPLLCGFRDGYGTQHALLRLIETCNMSIDSGQGGGGAGAFLTDLSKAFDCLGQELLIAKLNAYGFSRSALLFVHSSFDNRKQRVWFFQYVDKILSGFITRLCPGAPFVQHTVEPPYNGHQWDQCYCPL